MSSSVMNKGISIKIAAAAAVVIAGLAVMIQPVAAQNASPDLIAQDVTVKQFALHPNPKFASCLGVSGQAAPVARVKVTRGQFNDTLTITGQHFKPGLAFDMFTVQRTNLLPNLTVDPNFTNFGLAWYQSDLQANDQGVFTVTIQTILLDQIFGFDPDQSIPTPINTFHLGFWFNDPNDANVDGCVFDVTKPTPFNGEHKAGPLAMITTPTNGLGPLCTKPNTSTTPHTCNP